MIYDFKIIIKTVEKNIIKKKSKSNNLTLNILLKMSTIIKQSVYGRSKNSWKDEGAALLDICNKQFIQLEDLYPEHTTNKFVWKTFAGKSQEQQQQQNKKVVEPSKNTISFSKKEIETEKEAVEQAMNELETFESNLKPKHCEEYWAFDRVK